MQVKFVIERKRESVSRVNCINLRKFCRELDLNFNSVRKPVDSREVRCFGNVYLLFAIANYQLCKYAKNTRDRIMNTMRKTILQLIPSRCGFRTNNIIFAICEPFLI